MGYDLIEAAIASGYINFAMFLFRPSVTHEIPDLALAAIWWSAVFFAVFGASHVVRRHRLI